MGGYGRAACLSCGQEDFCLVFDGLPGNAAGNLICSGCYAHWGRVHTWSPSLGDEGGDAGGDQAVGKAGDVAVKLVSEKRGIK